MKSNEKEFALVLEDIKYNARMAGGFIPEEEVRAAFDSMELSDDQFQMVFDYLKQNNIGIGKPLNDGEILSEEDRDILEEYKKELENLPVISDGELRAATMALMNGDTAAGETVLNYYLPKVVEIARLYSSQGVLVEDLIGEGNLALSEGIFMTDIVEEPDELEGILVKLIMNAMEELISGSQSENTKEQKVADKVNKVADKARELSESLGRKVTKEELAEFSGLSIKAIEEAIRLSGERIEDVE